MSWKVRHEGSPKAVEGLTLQQIADGMQEGQWEPTDEVMGPGDKGWTAIEVHPQLAEVAAELEPPEPKHEEDESHLDMNALIDVCLVLLIFFILATSVAAVQKMLESPTMSANKVDGPRVVKAEEVKQFMVRVDARMVDGKPVITLEEKPVPREELLSALRGVGGGKANLLLSHDNDVPHGVVVEIQDKAKRAGLERIYLQVPQEEVAK